jgi:opacity protein-like surface antigen
MKHSVIFSALLTLVVASSLDAQLRPPAASSRNWAGAYVQMYTGMGSFDDPDTDSRWAFEDNSFGLGISLMRELGQSLMLGIDLSAARPGYERHITTAGVADTISGNATVATAMAMGRLAYGGAATLGLYLNGGIGTVAYRLSDLGSWDTDLGLRAGGGIEYRFQPNAAAFLEWGKLWGYHQKEGLSGGRVNHSVLSLGGRMGF